MSDKKLTILNEELLLGTGNDAFRDLFGAWSVNAGGAPTYSGNDSSHVTITSTKVEVTTDEEEFKKDVYSLKIGTNLPQGLLGGDKAASDVLFNSILSAINTSNTFEDFASEIQVPAITGEDLQAKVSYEYNFYDKSYERELEGVTTDLIEIPSLYGLAYDASVSEGLAAQLNFPTADLLSSNKRENRINGGFGKYTRQMVVGDPSESIGKWNENKNFFPMYTQIDVPCGYRRRIANDLQESFLAAAVMRDLIEEENLDSKVQDGLKLFLETEEGTTTGFDLLTDSVDLLTYWSNDVGAWGGRPSELPFTSMFIGQEGWYEEQLRIANPSGDFFVSPATEVILLRGKLDLILEEHSRTFEEILKGQKAHSEMVMYKISKFLGPIGNVPVQEFYFYNSGEEATTSVASSGVSGGTIQSFVDSQVRYDEEYSYVVTAFCAIVGSEYNYGAPTVGELAAGGDTILTVDVTVKPTIRLYEIPIFASTGKIFMQAPYYPQSYIEQIKGYTKGMLFSFDTQIGEMYDDPISLTTREKEYYDQLLSDPLKSKDGQVLFHSSAAMSGVQVYRTDEPPTSYDDFEGALLRTLRTDVDLSSDLTAAAVAKIINQPANKKYYYMFRSLGPHDEVSNPSPVYQVELYNDGGVAYPIVRLHELIETSRKAYTKSMKNLIRISPRITQALINEQASGLVDENGLVQTPQENNIVLGIEDEPLFGKTFKIRITSKDTGKKLDLNVTFNTEVNKAPSEAPPTGYVPELPEVGELTPQPGPSLFSPELTPNTPDLTTDVGPYTPPTSGGGVGSGGSSGGY